MNRNSHSSPCSLSKTVNESGLCFLSATKPHILEMEHPDPWIFETCSAERRKRLLVAQWEIEGGEASSDPLAIQLL